MYCLVFDTAMTIGSVNIANIDMAKRGMQREINYAWVLPCLQCVDVLSRSSVTNTLTRLVMWLEWLLFVNH